MTITTELALAVLGVLGNVLLYFLTRERRKTLKDEASAETAVLKEQIQAVEIQADIRTRDMVNKITEEALLREREALERERGLREEIAQERLRYAADRSAWNVRLEVLSDHVVKTDDKAQQSVQEALEAKALVAAQNDTIDRLQGRIAKLEAELSKEVTEKALLIQEKQNIEKAHQVLQESRQKEIDAAVSPLMDRIRLKRQIIQNQEGYIATLEAVLREHGIDYKKPSVLVETAPLKPTEPPEITPEPTPEASGESLVEVIGEKPHEHNGNS